MGIWVWVIVGGVVGALIVANMRKRGRGQSDGGSGGVYIDYTNRSDRRIDDDSTSDDGGGGDGGGD